NAWHRSNLSDETSRRGFTVLLVDKAPQPFKAGALFRFLFGGRLRGVAALKDRRAAALRLAVAGRELQRLGEVGLGAVKIVACQEGPAAADVGRGIIRFDFDRAREVCNRSLFLA